jgi:hypothetical protein
LEGLVSQTKQVLQFAEEAINNTMKAVQKIQRDQMQQQGVEGPEADMMQQDSKLQEHQVKMQIAQEKAELDMAIKQKKHEQEMAIRDAKAALEFRENSLNNA